MIFTWRVYFITFLPGFERCYNPARLITDQNNG